MTNTIGFKLPADAPITKVAPIIRKYEPMSISEIKSRITNNNYILEYDVIDEKGLAIILKCYKELLNIGISTSIFEHDRVCDIQLLKNMSIMYQEISDMIDIEAED